MDRWIALLKGVNVGGNNRIKSAELAEICRGLGWADVATVLASGNVVFRADGASRSLAGDLSHALRLQKLDVPVLVIGGKDMAERRAACPYVPREGKHVHGFFCLSPPVFDEALARELATDSEEIVVMGRTVWLHTPDGFGTSKLAENLHKVVTGTDMTARNLNTITKLVEMLDR